MCWKGYGESCSLTSVGMQKFSFFYPLSPGLPPHCCSIMKEKRGSRALDYILKCTGRCKHLLGHLVDGAVFQTGIFFFCFLRGVQHWESLLECGKCLCKGRELGGRQGKWVLLTLASWKLPLCSCKGCLYGQKRLLRAVGVCVRAAACLGAIDCRIRSINRINTTGLRHWDT